MFSYSTTVEHVTISVKSRLAAVTVSHALTDPLQALASVFCFLARHLTGVHVLVVCGVFCFMLARLSFASSFGSYVACMEADNSNQRIFAQLVESKRMTKPLFYHNYSHVVARNCWCAFASSSLRVQQRFLADVGFDTR